MASNPINNALRDLRKAVLPLIKGYLLQEGAANLSTYYVENTRPNTVPDRKSKRGNLYYSQPNTTNRLRTLYGNIQRALAPDGRNKGNITEIIVEGNEVVLSSGIDLDATVKAGKRRTTLYYAAIHEYGLAGFRARPFLEPGIAEFNKKEMPGILEDIADDLTRYYNAR